MNEENPNFLIELSKQYGTGEVMQDAMICVGAIAVFFLLLGLLSLFRGKRQDKRMYEGQILDKEVKDKIDVLHEDLHHTIDMMRDDYDALKGELEDIRRAIAEVKDNVTAPPEYHRTVDIAMASGAAEQGGGDDFDDIFDYDL